MSATLAALAVSALAVRPAPRPQPEIQARFRIDGSVTTRTARRGHPVPLRTASALTLDGVPIPIGSPAEGVVAEAVRPGRVRGRGTLVIDILSVTPPDGVPIRVSGTYVAAPPQRPRSLYPPPPPYGPVLAGMAAGYGSAAIAAEVFNAETVETIAGTGVIVGLSTGIMVGVLKRGEDIQLTRGRIIEVTLERRPPYLPPN